MQGTQGEAARDEAEALDLDPLASPTSSLTAALHPCTLILALGPCPRPLDPNLSGTY